MRSSRSVGRLVVNWFEGWHDDLGAALQSLPEIPNCPHELYRDLILTRGTVPKRTALVTHRGTPIAVVCVRQDESRWTPVTTWVIPGVLFPVRDGYLLDVLHQLDVPLFMAWWRQDSPPPHSERFKGMQAVPTRKLPCTAGFEQHWGKSGLLRDIRVARRKCQHLTVEINRPGAAEWTLKNWGIRWAQPGTSEVVDTRDRITVARYWEPRGRQFTVSLMDGDTYAASGVVFLHGREIVGQANFREPAYDKLGVGRRLFDAVQQWAIAQGYDKHDFGGGLTYKENWAPEDGMRWNFIIEPRQTALKRIQTAMVNRIRYALGR